MKRPSVEEETAERETTLGMSGSCEKQWRLSELDARGSWQKGCATVSRPRRVSGRDKKWKRRHERLGILLVN